MKKVSVVYHSGNGFTTNQAKGIVDGIDSIENASANLIVIDQGGDITECDQQTLIQP